MIDLDCGFGGVKLNWEILTVWLFIGFCLILLLLNCEIIECLMHISYGMSYLQDSSSILGGKLEI